MSKTIPCRKVYKFRMEPTEIEALELERSASVARYIYNFGLERCQQNYQQSGKSKPWAELSANPPPFKAGECQKIFQAEANCHQDLHQRFDSRCYRRPRAGRPAGAGPGGLGLHRHGG
jgi:hypothetical protein